MKALILKDMYFLKSNLAFYLLTMVIFLTVELTGGSWGMTAIWASTIPCTIYITDERTGWLTVCGTLPVERKTIVAEKYLFTLICDAVIFVFGIAVKLMLSAFGVGGGFGLIDLATYFFVSTVVFLSGPAVILPLSMKIGGQKGLFGWVLVLPLNMAAIIIGVLAKTSIDVGVFGIKNMTIIMLAMFLFSILLFAASYPIAVAAFKHKEL